MEKKTFIIPCVWQMMGHLKIEAESLEDAIMVAERPETSLPIDGEYLTDSFEIDHDGLGLWNDEEKGMREEYAKSFSNLETISQ